MSSSALVPRKAQGAQDMDSFMWTQQQRRRQERQQQLRGSHPNKHIRCQDQKQKEQQEQEQANESTTTNKHKKKIKKTNGRSQGQKHGQLPTETSAALPLAFSPPQPSTSTAISLSLPLSLSKFHRRPPLPPPISIEITHPHLPPPLHHPQRRYPRVPRIPSPRPNPYTPRSRFPSQTQRLRLSDTVTPLKHVLEAVETGYKRWERDWGRLRGSWIGSGTGWRTRRINDGMVVWEFVGRDDRENENDNRDDRGDGKQAGGSGEEPSSAGHEVKGKEKEQDKDEDEDEEYDPDDTQRQVHLTSLLKSLEEPDFIAALRTGMGRKELAAVFCWLSARDLAADLGTLDSVGVVGGVLTIEMKRVVGRDGTVENWWVKGVLKQCGQCVDSMARKKVDWHRMKETQWYRSDCPLRPPSKPSTKEHGSSEEPGSEDLIEFD